MYDSILVATDDSEAANAAVEHAVHLADRYDASLAGVAVRETRTGYDAGVLDPEDVERRLEERATAALATLEAAASEAGVAVETTRRTGVSHEEILAEAADRDADLIVLGSRGRSTLKGALLGSTVDAVLRYADRPVLVVAPDEAAE